MQPTSCAISSGTHDGQSTALRSRILDVAEGNPLFVEEVVAMLADDGVLTAGDGRQRLTR